MTLHKEIKMQLIPKSKKGKERCKRDGDTGWSIIQVTNAVFFSNEVGPWWRIWNGNLNTSRWVHSTNDDDFKLITTKGD
mgnify:CR=1 FL=1|tara:strand:+ start:923 stop:1159 length:237 start_codon:yes stop_codon:yes gene_type:complete